MRKRRKAAGSCPNHTKLPADVYQAEAIRHAQKLREALAAARRIGREDLTLWSILGHGRVFEEVEGLDMAVAAISFPSTSSGPTVVMGFTWEWIEANGVDEIAGEIIEQAQEAMVAGELPKSADEFILEAE